MESPSTVLLPVTEPPAELPAEPSAEPPEEAVTATCGVVCGFSDSSSTIAETVAALARTMRRTGRFLFNACTSTASQLERLVVDTAVRHTCGAQRLVHVLGETVRPAEVHVVPGQIGYGRPQRLGGEARALPVRPVEHVVHLRPTPPRYRLQLPAQREVFGRTRPVQESDLSRQ